MGAPSSQTKVESVFADAHAKYLSDKRIAELKKNDAARAEAYGELQAGLAHAISTAQRGGSGMIAQEFKGRINKNMRVEDIVALEDKLKRFRKTYGVPTPSPDDLKK